MLRVAALLQRRENVPEWYVVPTMFQDAFGHAVGMTNPTEQISYFARSNHRHPFRRVGIKQSDRLSHLYVIGKTGVGKTTLLETLITQDIAAGRGCALIDPHGDFVERVVAAIPPARQSDVIYLDVPDAGQPYGYNPLARVNFELRPLVASGLMDVLKKMWDDAWGVRMEHILRNTLLALLDQPAAILPDILLMLSDKEFRQRALRKQRVAQDMLHAHAPGFGLSLLLGSWMS